MMTGVCRCVGVSVKKRLHAAATKLCRQVWLVGGKRRTVSHGTMIHRILAGKQRGSGRTTGCRDRHMVRKAHGIGHKFPKVGKLRVQPKRTMQAVRTHLVENNKQNILTCHGRGPIDINLTQKAGAIAQCQTLCLKERVWQACA